MSLPFKRRLFAHRFVKNKGNGSKSYRESGYQGNNSVCEVEAHRLLRNPKVQAEIRRVTQKVFQGNIMSAQEVLGRLSKQARASLADVLTDSGEFDLQSAKANDTDDLLKKLKVRKLKDGSIEHEYELHDPQNALVQMARVHKLLTDKLETEDKTPANSTKLISDALQSALESLALKRPDLDLSLSSEEIDSIAQAAVNKAASGVSATSESESDSRAVN